MNRALDQYQWYSLLLILAVSLFNIIYNSAYPLHVDEAYYWLMSKHVAAGFFDIPPMLPLMIRIFGIFGDAEWAVRLTSTFSFAIAALYLFKLSAQIYNPRTGLWVVAAFLSLPVIQIGSTIITTDAPHMLFWTMASYYSYLALRDERTRDFIITGVLVGLALLSKYTAVLLPTFFFLFIIWKRPHLLATPKPWIGAIIMLVVFSPNIYWNYQHGWDAFLFRYQYGTGSSDVVSFSSIGEYIGGAVLLFTPIYFFIYFRYFARNWSSSNAPAQWLLFLSALVFIFFGYKSIYKEMALNWYAPAAILGLIFVSGFLEKRNSKKIYIGGLVISLMITMLVKFPDQLNMPSHANIKNRVVGYEEAVAAFAKTLPNNDVLTCGDYYTTASIVAYLMPHTQNSVLEPFTSTRKSDFDYWGSQGGANGLEGRSCYLFMDRPIIPAVESQCKQLTQTGSFLFADPRYVEKRFYFYHCDNSEQTPSADGQETQSRHDTEQ